MKPNRYQLRKGRMLAAAMIQAACLADVPLWQLPKMAAAMTGEHWRTMSFNAGQPVADVPARVACIAFLGTLA